MKKYNIHYIINGRIVQVINVNADYPICVTKRKQLQPTHKIGTLKIVRV